MPDKYRVTISDGRTFDVMTEGGAPSEADILSNLPANDTPQFGDPSLHPTIGPISDTPSEPTWKDKLGAMMQGAAHPTGLSDLLPLFIPAGAETAVKAFTGYAAALSEAMENAPNLKMLPREFSKVLLKNATAARPIVGFDRYAPNVSSAVTPGVEGATQIPPLVERYAPNVSSDVTAGVDTAIASAPKQATYTQMPDGSFGIRGAGLKPGDTVHVMSRKGVGTMQKVGQIVSDANGVQTATLGSAPKLTLTAKDVSRVQQLIQQNVPPEIALKTVLELKGAVH